MVHQMSGESETYILSVMPFARGLQYQNEWYRIVRNELLYKDTENKGLRVIL